MSKLGLMRSVGLFLVASGSLGPIAFAQRQANGNPKIPPAESKNQSSPSNRPVRPDSLYEDENVKVPIPRGWKILKVGSPDDPLVAHPPSVPQTFIPPPGRGLVLSSGGYFLTLAYRTGHASPIKGGRIIEVFDIPWLQGIDDGWACGDYLRKIPRRADGLRFISLTLDQPSSEIQRICLIPENVNVNHRWFAGYFTTPESVNPKGNYGGFFFDSKRPGCPERAYTLTSSAKTPAELPNADDPALMRVIGEAIAIVASIHYKRCAPVQLP